MVYDFNSSEPIYIQLLDIFRERIANGSWEAGSKMDSVRNLALDYGVNPNTVQRALSELEREGFCYSERTAGRFITKDGEMIKELRRNILRQEGESLVRRARALRLDKEDLDRLINLLWQSASEGGRDLDSEEGENRVNY